jgi:predicted transcriptional regulator of viral defense system
MENNLRTLGPNEAKVVLSLRADECSLIRSDDVVTILGSKPKARKVIYNLVRKGWLSRLVGGRYLFLPPEHGPTNIGENNAFAIASAIVEQSYIGWWAAASFHGFTTQKPMAITVAVRQQAPTRTIEGAEIRFVTLVPRKFFGSYTEMAYGRPIKISTKVKTLVDCIDRPDLAGGPSELARITFGASQEVEMADVFSTARQMKSTALLQRLGALADLVGWTMSDNLRIQLRRAIPKSARTTLGRQERRNDDIGYIAEWGIFINAAKRDLLADVPRIQAKNFHEC